MKIPKSAEEYLVWPPVGSLAGLVVTFTLSDCLDRYHSDVVLVEGGSIIGMYVISIGMGAALAAPLHGKYWLGFAWMAFLGYLMALLVRMLPAADWVSMFYVAVFSCVVMFSVQSAVLYWKRTTINAERHNKAKQPGTR